MGDVLVDIDGAPLSGSAIPAFGAFAVGASVTFGFAPAASAGAGLPRTRARTLETRTLEP